MTEYPPGTKAVRDGIGRASPQKTRILSDGEFLPLLEAKLPEETAEYLRERDDRRAMMELVDIQDVCERIAQIRGWTPDMLERARADKRAHRGGFDGNVIWSPEGFPAQPATPP